MADALTEHHDMQRLTLPVTSSSHHDARCIIKSQMPDDTKVGNHAFYKHSQNLLGHPKEPGWLLPSPLSGNTDWLVV